jgi:hypothetical protein
MPDRITTKFNLFLIAYLSAQGIFTFFLKMRATNVPVEGVIVTSLLDFGRYMIVLTISTWFFMEFWRRLVATVVPVRSLEFRESMAVLLVLSMLHS